ncbi:MAG TPA: lysophospholipid acyltransferase family protein [Pseudomonadota bacterium]|jgi:1-acyl-sn-glycerol-3-phosphate acyltransferase|nr:lysophospholipid acyltransferase family protein [Pseudomonadota bacterium]HNK45147.1 lysophospholipid acyltransferase family protein [Pseudomonadota bacterium]HNN50610.1 lysophospholipid acyltransferase family protein [Pseudomonadota bacterium]
MLRIRAFLTSFFIIAYTIFMSVVAVVTWPLSPRGDLFLTFAKIWSRVIFFVGGIRWVTQRSDKLDLQKSYLYLSNHESLTDILALYATLPQKAVMVAKRSLFILPVFSWGMWLAGFIFINRKNTKEAYARLQSAGKLIRKGRSVLVFPEGTRGDGGELLRLKRGGFVLAQTAQIEVVPVGIAGTAEVLPRDTFPVYPGSIAVCIGEPMAPPRPDEDLPRYMDRVRAEIDKLRAVAREQAAKNR